MSVPRTLSPSLSSLVGKDQAAAVAQSAAFIGLASRAARARQTAAPLLITKAEAAFLRNYMASGADPLTAIREASVQLSAVSHNARTLAVATNAQRIDIPKVKAGQTGVDGRALAVSIPKATPDAQRPVLLTARHEHADGAKALALLDTLHMLRVAWDAARAQSVAFASINPEKAAKAPGKRLEAHAAALLTADPTQVATLLKAMGLPDEAIGAILATMAAKAQPAAVVPAIAQV